MPYVLALLVGVVAGSRTMMAPAAVAWFARLGLLTVAGTPLGFLGNVWTCGIFTLLAAVELVVDQLPSTASRTVPVQFGARLVSGGLAGAAVGTAGGSIAGGLIAGILGAVVGTLGGRALRGRLATKFGNDHPAAFLEDAAAIALAALIGVALR